MCLFLSGWSLSELGGLLAVVAFTCGAAWLLYLWFTTINVDYFKRNRVDPSIPVVPGSSSKWWGALPILDHANVYHSFIKWGIQYYPIYKIQLFEESIVGVSDPELIKQVIASPHARDKALNYQRLLRVLGPTSLVLVSDQEWYPLRRLNATAFHHQNIENYMRMFQDCAEVLTQRLLKVPNTSIDFDNYATYVTIDVISRCLFSRDVGAQNDSPGPVVQAVKEISQELHRSIFNPLHFLNLVGRYRWYKTEKLLRDTLQSILTEKRARMAAEERGEVQPAEIRDLLDILMRAKDAETGAVLSDEDLYWAFVGFFFGGHDTTAHTLAWACHFVGSDPCVEERLLRELQEVMGDRLTPTQSDIGRLKYLNSIIKETLRIYPPVPQITRMVAQDFDITAPSGKVYHLSKGTSVTLQYGSIQQNPAFWPDPMIFNPDRFQDDTGRHPYSWMPFSMGDRNCIGMGFALLEVKVIMATLFRRLQFRPDRLRMPSLVAKTTHAPADGIWLIVNPRNKPQ